MQVLEDQENFQIEMSVCWHGRIIRRKRICDLISKPKARGILETNVMDWWSENLIFCPLSLKVFFEKDAAAFDKKHTCLMKSINCYAYEWISGGTVLLPHRKNALGSILVTFLCRICMFPHACMGFLWVHQFLLTVQRQISLPC